MSYIHLQDWIKWLEPDFYTLFVKSWIPFNAWYVDSFYDEAAGRKADREILDYIQENPNKFRDKLVNLLNGSGNDVEKFYYHLNLLDDELESHTVVNRGRRVQFSNISLSSNPLHSKIFEYRTYKYKCEHITTPSSSWKCQIMRKSDSSTVCQFSMPKWDEQVFLTQPDYMALTSQTQKDKLLECFRMINPRPVAELVLNVKYRSGIEFPPSRSICISETRKRYFTNDTILIAKCIIELLYSLRCMVFHGHLDPTGSNSQIYEHAFYIMNIVTKELI